MIPGRAQTVSPLEVRLVLLYTGPPRSRPADRPGTPISTPWAGGDLCGRGIEAADIAARLPRRGALPLNSRDFPGDGDTIRPRRWLVGTGLESGLDPEPV